MPTFIVTKKEIWDQPVRVEAKDKEEALKKVWDGEGELIEDGFEFADTMKTDVWNAEEVTDE